MYYSRACSYCTKIFYTYQDNREAAATILFEGIKAHLVEYEEDHKEYEFDEEVSVEIDQMYYEMTETSEEPPEGHYRLD
ncbi:MAG TPA: hypothetical protein VG965_06845 [Patescibacteria group bacterium]|nr:hypothetical protein [Patescibacteria group bacterium]